MKSSTCEKVQTELLAYSPTDKKPDWVDKHMRSCQYCQVYARTISGFEHLFSVHESQEIQPAAWVSASLEQRLKRTAPERISFYRKMSHWFGGLMNRRVPVYQAAISGALLILIGIIMISGLRYGHEDSVVVHATSAPKDSLLYQQLGIIYSLEILDKQKIGCSVNDDSSLTRYLQTM